MKKIRVWTWGHRPFVMGGRVNYPLATDVEALGPFPLGKGFSGYEITAPNGRTFIAEATTGAFVGPSLKAVKADIEACEDSKLMQGQVDEAAKELPNLEVVDSKEFWRMLKCEK